MLPNALYVALLRTIRLLRYVFTLSSDLALELDVLHQGLRIPEVLRPYMQGREFLPWVKELPKTLQKKKA